MAKTAVEKAPTSAAPREVPIIKPRDISVQEAGFHYKTMVVNLPESLTFQDLNDHPEIWKLVQAAGSGKALCEFDKLELRAFEWTAYAAVNHADNERVVLYDIRKASKPRREVALYSDNTYDVRWSHDGYGFFRTADNIRMGNATYQTPEAAKAALIREMYPASIR